jgi:hypothetical protein
MTIQLASIRHGQSKAALQSALNTMPDRVEFHDPSIMAPRWFVGADMAVGERFPIVMDPATRRRFATVARTDKGFRVT